MKQRKRKQVVQRYYHGFPVAVRIARVNSHTTGWSEWGTQNLPTPGVLLAALVGGKGCRVNGHKLSPDEHGVWITNPYGVDCGLWQELTLQRVEEFLIDMAQDKDYGPVP